MAVCSLLALLALFQSPLELAAGCTEILLRSTNSDFVVVNTVEAPNYFHLPGRHLRPVRRGEWWGGGPFVPPPAFVAQGFEYQSDECMSFQVKYGFVGTMNEKGLTVHHHALNLAAFQNPVPGKSSLCKRHLDGWALGLFASVREVASALEGVSVVGGPPVWGGTLGGQWGLQDETGEAIVVEFVKGELRIHNNTQVGVLTNDPTWDWHVANLNQFSALQPSWYGDNNADVVLPVGVDQWYPYSHNAYDTNPPQVPTAIGQGLNLLGLPGDSSPAARFVRAFYLRQYAVRAAPPRDLNETLILGQELLNAVYKVRGTAASPLTMTQAQLDPELLEGTPVATLEVPRSRELYTRSRADLTWRRVDLKRLDFSPGAAVSVVEVAKQEFFAIDVTDEFLGAEGSADGGDAVYA